MGQIHINGFFELFFTHPIVEHHHDRRGLLSGQSVGRVIIRIPWHDCWRGQRPYLIFVVIQSLPLLVDDEKVL